MEVIDKDNPKSWTSFVNKFRKPKVRHSHLESEDDIPQENNIIYENDKQILEEQDIEENYKTTPEEPLQVQSEKLVLEEQPRIEENDQNFLDKHSKIFQTLGFTSNEKPLDEDKQKQKIERCISIIKKLHQKEIGNFSRLESISNYLTDGQQLLYEDEQYLREQYKKLEEAVELDEDFDYQKSSVPNKDPSEPQTILIDDVEENPTDDFTSLSITIANIIKDSTPHFTIGIYGEWGTGKTTLMKAIEKNLSTEGVPKNEQKILPVWFNAWQYDREEHLATISLMKTVAYEMSGHKKFDAISKTILKGLTILGKDLTQNLIQEIVSKGGFEKEDDLEEKINHLNELYRDSIYFDGLKKIKQQMEDIRKSGGKDFRVVIFIDDLDRCSPDKALEILESIKLFLGMEGFIFVVGLSHKTVTELITKAYAATGVKGEDYIKKIIQIPIKIPAWSQESILDLIENKIKMNLHEEYTNFLSQNSDMIARVVDYNPRQLKRFVNNVIIAFETFTSKANSPEIKFNDIFLVKILKSEWPDFYTEIVRNKDFLEILKWMLTKPRELKRYFKYLNTYTEEGQAEQKQQRFLLLNKLSERTGGRIDSRHIEILSDFDYESWIFFAHVKDVLFGIKDWKVINTIINVVEEFSYDLPVGSSKSKKSQTPS